MKYNSKVKVQLYEISPEELVELIKDSVVNEMKDLIKGMDKKNKSNEYLSRKDTCILLKIDQSTLYRWTKSGQLKSYGIGNRVYYLKEDIQKVLLENKLN